jgi:hypothetical protein
MSSGWLIDAADLLAEPDPGPTPWLVEGLIVDRAIVACVGRWKTTKSYGLLDVCISIATGEPAFGALRIPEPGPVIYICEESGKAALYRRLDALCRGRAIAPERLRGRLHVAANAGVRLDEPAWLAELAASAASLDQTRLIVGDPLARMKSAGREENAQGDMAYVIEGVRMLREETNAAVGFVHNTGHTGGHMRGSSDLESAWETRLTWERDGQSPEITIKAEHREAEASDPTRYRIAWDGDTRSMRFPLIEAGDRERVRAYLAEHPTASANDIIDALKLKRQTGLKLVKEVKAEGGSHDGNHSGTTPSGTALRSGSQTTPFRGLGTTSAESPLELVPEAGTGHVLLGDPMYPNMLAKAVRHGRLDLDEARQLYALHGAVVDATDSEGLAA